METVVAAFVGYAPSMDLPWAADTDHGKALYILSTDQDRCEWHSNHAATWYGFVIKDGDNYRYADRKEALRIAQEANQMNGRKGLPGRLDSFQIATFDSKEMLHVQNLSWDTNESFTGKTFECDTDNRLTVNDI